MLYGTTVPALEKYRDQVDFVVFDQIHIRDQGPDEPWTSTKVGKKIDEHQSMH